MAKYVSRYANLIIAGGPSGEIKFGVNNPPGEYNTVDEDEITFIEAHKSYNIDIFTDAIPDTTDPGEIFTQDEESAVEALTEAMTSI